MRKRLNVTRLCGSLLCAFTLFLIANFSFGQGTSSPPSTSAQPNMPGGINQAKVGDDGNSTVDANKADNCFLPPLNGLQMSTTGVAMQVPAKTRHEFDEGCAALRNKKFADAEGHLRKTVKQDPRFSAAWVLLGQIFEAQQKMDDAHDACSKPTGSYLPAYLCLADISAHAKNWVDVLRLSSLALEIDPMTAPAYAYNASANFNLHNLPAAEESALRAINIDKANGDPRVHFLLAQIYEAKGDRANEASQLHEYLKYATDSNDAEIAKKLLGSLEPQAVN
jgi:tetratricopeptide (TPR) repeat protein